MTAIRIATVTYDWYPFDVRVRRLAEATAHGGYQMDVICLRQEGEAPNETRDGVRVYRLPISRGVNRSLPLTLLRWCWFLVIAGAKVTALHFKKRYDVIHVHNMPDFLVFAALVPKLLGATVILDVQDVTPELMAAKARGRKRTILWKLAEWQERVSTAFADYVVTVGWPFEEILLRRGVPQSKLTSILNSADPHIFPASRRCPPPSAASTPTAERAFIVMYWGTIAERNGVDIAVRAVARAREVVPHVRLDIMGNGDQVPTLKQLASDLGIAEHITFTRSVPSERIVDFVVHGDIGIIPYRLDGFAELVLPTKAYELAWMQRPIIASDTPAIRSMFRPESMLLCEPESPDSFAAAIVTLYERPELRERMVANAAVDYEKYRWEDMAERYQQLLFRLARRGNQPSATQGTDAQLAAGRKRS